MARLALAFVFVALCAITFDLASAQTFSYRVTIHLADTYKFDKEVKAKLKITLKGSQGSHKYALSADTESLGRGGIKSYTIAAPLNIGQIDKVSVEFSKKFGWGSLVKAAKIYVEKVTIEPTYISNIEFRQRETKNLCSSSDYASMKHADPVEFWRQC